MRRPLDLGHPAEARVPIHELIHERWSPRDFEPRVPNRETLLSLFEAARWAPSSFNEQPWSFVLATSDQPDEHGRLADCLLDANKAWAGKAPVLALSIASGQFARNDRENRHAWHDVGLAVSQLTLQAASMELGVHQMAGFSAERAVETYAIPESHAPVAVLAIGYFPRPEPEARSARSRKVVEEMLFGSRFGEVHPLVGP